MTCAQCKKEFTPKRKTAKYCSAKCRKLAFQVSVPENAKISVPVVSVPELKPVLEVPPEIKAQAEQSIAEGFPNEAETIIEAWKARWVLENHDLKTLEANKVWIPNWRRFRDKYENQ